MIIGKWIILSRILMTSIKLSTPSFLLKQLIAIIQLFDWLI